jgi:hypothetical protein
MSKDARSIGEVGAAGKMEIREMDRVGGASPLAKYS